MTAPLISPPLPLLTPIPGGFLHGKIIRINGSVGHSAHRFAINLQCGPLMNPMDDLALHFNPRFHEKHVVRNTLLSGHWGHEEHHGHFPFHHEQGFEVLILAESNEYKIAVNGHHFAEFNFRTAPERVSYLSIEGDVMITMVSFEGGHHGGHHAHGAIPPLGPGHAHGAIPPLGPMPGPMYPPHGHHGASGMTPSHLPPLGPMPTPGHGAYPVQPAMNPYPMTGQYPPGSQPHAIHSPYPTQSPYPSQSPYPYPAHSSGKGASGLLEKASTAVAGALAYAGVGGLARGLAGARHGNGYAPPSYPNVSPYPGFAGPRPMAPMAVGAGGLLGGLGTVLGAAAMGKAVLNPKKAMKQQRKAQKKALKYGLPLAGVGVGAYALHKGMKHGHHGFHHGSSSSSSSSSSEEE